MRDALLLLMAVSLVSSCSNGDPAGPGTDTGLQPEDPTGRTTAIVNVTVVPMTGEGALEGRTVLVRGETIVEVGDAAAVDVPAEARVVDGTGRWLMPGLADMHTHLGTNWAEYENRVPPTDGLQEMARGQMLLYLANGVTTILNLGDFVEPVLMWRGQVLEGRYPGPTIYSGRWLRGPPGTDDGGPPRDAPTTPVGARELVRETAAEGHHLLKIYNWPSREVVSVAMDEARALGLGVAGHIPRTMPPDEVFASGMDLAAHAEAYLWTLFDFQVADHLVPDAVAMTAEADASVVTTLGLVKTKTAVWGGDEAGIAEFWSLPEVRYMHRTERGLHREGLEGSRWNPSGARPGGYDGRYEFVKRYTRTFHDAGIQLLLGTDSPTVLGAAGFSMHRELAVHRELGFTDHEILTMATRNAGDFVEEQVSEASRFGRVEPGYRADLLLLDADPLASLENVRSRVAVMARGRLYLEEDLQAGIEELAARYGG